MTPVVCPWCAQEGLIQLPPVGRAVLCQRHALLNREEREYRVEEERREKEAEP